MKDPYRYDLFLRWQAMIRNFEWRLEFSDSFHYWEVWPGGLARIPSEPRREGKSGDIAEIPALRRDAEGCAEAG